MSLYDLCNLYRETTADEANAEISTTALVAQVLQSSDFSDQTVSRQLNMGKQVLSIGLQMSQL